MWSPSLSILLAAAAGAGAFSLPKPPGKYDVGTTSFELIDYDRNDTLAPSPQPRDLMIQVFYPACEVEGYPVSSIFTPRLAEYTKAQSPAFTSEALLSIRTQAHINATFAKVKPTLLIFSHGATGWGRAYSGLLSALASEGYMTLAIDHPYDSAVVEYPDGRFVFGRNLTFQEYITTSVDARQRDISFLMDKVQEGLLTGRIPGFEGQFETSSIGVYGHSLGGATSAKATLLDSRISCMVNLDGPITDEVAYRGLDQPSLLMSAGARYPLIVQNWPTFLNNSRGYKWHLVVENTQHLSFSDAPFILDAVNVTDETVRRGFLDGSVPGSQATLPGEGQAGSVSGPRILEIQTSYLDAFFGTCLEKRNETLLDGPSEEFREVTFVV